MSKNYFQDDFRESKMIELFELVRDTSEGRTGVDAFLELGKHIKQSSYTGKLLFWLGRNN
jgi:hypothetical protein